MAEPTSIENQADGRSRGGNPYLLLLLATALLYILTGCYLYRYNRTVVPNGDAFTYTLGFFHIVDSAHQSYFSTLLDVVSNPNWYWLQNVVIALLSPVLVKEPQSIALANFVVFFLATVSVFRLAKQFGATTPAAFLLSFITWLGPFSYGVYSQVSLLTLMLDTMFLGMLTVALLNMVLLAIRPLDVKQAIAAGLAAGLAVWGRGSSLPYVLIAVSCPLLIIAWGVVARSSIQRIKRLGNLALFLALFSGMAGWYYYFTLDNIRSYYSYLPSFHATDSGITGKLSAIVHPAPWVTMNIPGFFFYPKVDAVATMWISCTAHLVVLALALRRFQSPLDRQRSVGRAGPAHRLRDRRGRVWIDVSHVSDRRRALGGTPPIRHVCSHAGGSCVSVVSLIAPPLIARGDSSVLSSRAFMPAVILLGLVYGAFWTKQQSRMAPLPETDMPADVERFSLNLDRYLKDGKLAVVWYRMYNEPILHYYRCKNGRPYYPSFAKYDYALRHTVADRIPYQDFRDALRKTMLEADYVIIPESLEDYALVHPCCLQRYGAKEMGEFLDSPDCPRYAIKETLRDFFGHRLLLLQRLKPGDSSEGCRLLPHPYCAAGSASVPETPAMGR